MRMPSSVISPRVHGMLPPSMSTRPGSNSPSPFTGHLTDATSGTAATGGQGAGYGSYVDPGFYAKLQGYINSIPDVAAARMNLTTKGGQSYDQMRQAIQSTLTNFGDPSAFGGGGQSLAALFGKALDPQTAAIARANTVGVGGSVGNSIVAQLHHAAQSALQNKLQEIGGSGFQSSGGSGAELNESNIRYGHDVYTAGQQALGQVTGAINDNNTTQLGLNTDLQGAIMRGSQYVSQHPGLYPMPTTPITTVGGGMPQSPVGKQMSPYPQTNPMTFKAAPGGPGVMPTRTGGGIPLPKLPAAPTVGGMGHTT